MNFTDARWRAKDIRGDGKWYVIGPDDITIIALCNSGNADNEANAQLIAASPEMYKMLKGLEWACSYDDDSMCPYCGNFSCAGHGVDCALKALIDLEERVNS